MTEENQDAGCVELDKTPDISKYQNKDQHPNDRIFNIIFDQDEITWQSIIYELVKTNEVDPWDVDISVLTGKYIQMVKELKEHDFRVSGKVVLALALLLKIKSKRLVGEDLNALDQLFAQSEEEEVDGLFDEEVKEKHVFDYERMGLFPRTPQPRKRKVSVYDLVRALEKALEVKKRRVVRYIPEGEIELPKKSRDVSTIIKELYFRIKNFFLSNKGNSLTFSNLIPSNEKQDKIYTFIPLLHLANQRKVELNQEKPFGEIGVMIRTEKEIEEEIGEVAQ